MPNICCNPDCNAAALFPWLHCPRCLAGLHRPEHQGITFTDLDEAPAFPDVEPDAELMPPRAADPMYDYRAGLWLLDIDATSAQE